MNKNMLNMGLLLGLFLLIGITAIFAGPVCQTCRSASATSADAIPGRRNRWAVFESMAMDVPQIQ